MQVQDIIVNVLMALEHPMGCVYSQRRVFPQPSDFPWPDSETSSPLFICFLFLLEKQKGL